MRKGGRQFFEVLHVGWRLLDKASTATCPHRVEHEAAEQCGPHARVEEPAPPVTSQVVHRSEGRRRDPWQPDGTEKQVPFRTVLEEELDPSLGIAPVEQECAGKMCEHFRLNQTLSLRRKGRVLLQGPVEDGRAAARLADDEDRVHVRHRRCNAHGPVGITEFCNPHRTLPAPLTPAQQRGRRPRRAIRSTRIWDMVPSLGVTGHGAELVCPPIAESPCCRRHPDNTATSVDAAGGIGMGSSGYKEPRRLLRRCRLHSPLLCILLT